MSESLDIIDGERSARVLKLNIAVFENNFNLDNSILASALSLSQTGLILGVLQQLPNPSLRCSFLILMVKLVETIDNFSRELIVEVISFI